MLLRTWHISGGGGGGGGVGGAGGAGGEERQAFVDTTAKTFSGNRWPLLRHFFFGGGAQNELAGGVVSLFPM